MNEQFVPVFTQIIALTGATAASVGISPSSAGSFQGCEISNLSTNGAYAAFGGSGVVATIPTTSGSTNGFYISPSASRRLACPPNAFISAISTGNTLVGALAVTYGSFI